MLVAKVLLSMILLLQPLPPDIPDVPQPPDEISFETNNLSGDVETITNTDIIPKSDVYNFLATAVDNINALPDDPTFINGVPLLPDDTATQLFSYLKWVFSSNSAREMLGETLAPIALPLWTLLLIYVVTYSISLTVFLVSVIRRFVAYIICVSLKLIPGFG